MDFIGLFLDKNKGQSLYTQLYETLARQIRHGEIPPGEKLPGKRRAAEQLGVSINTVDQAYQMLAAEGYVDARPRSGFVVNRLEHQIVPPPSVAVETMASPEIPAPAFSRQNSRYSFASGDIDVSLFPSKIWNRIFREVLLEPSLFSAGEPFGDPPLRLAISNYLHGYRGVRCTAQQVVVGAGLEQLISMLARMLHTRTIALENPGYPKTSRILTNEGVTTCFVPVDGDGMRIDHLAASGAKAAYLTPSHQFPTGAVMPVTRRGALLSWAESTGSILIEDDYDSEFRFDGRPLPSLQGMDTQGRVVYAGTFSRSLAPGLRVAYLVLPPGLLEEWSRMYGGYSCTVSRPEQHTRARFMSEGHFARGLNRMRIAYRKKRDILVRCLSKELPKSSYKIHNAHTGHYLVLELKNRDAQQVASQAARRHIYLRTLASYQMQPYKTAHPGSDFEGLILGYGGFAEPQIETAVKELAAIIREG